jgi:hypothetical protein
MAYAVGYIFFAPLRGSLMWFVANTSAFFNSHPIKSAADALCNEKVAFLRRTKVICTLDAAVSVYLVAVRPFFQTVQKCGPMYA